MAWNEKDHPRVPQGSSEGGQFTTVIVNGGAFNALEKLKAAHGGTRVSGNQFKFKDPDAKLFAQAVNQQGGGAFASIVPAHLRGQK